MLRIGFGRTARFREPLLTLVDLKIPILADSLPRRLERPAKNVFSLGANQE
jgi:hypothetical protein